MDADQSARSFMGGRRVAVGSRRLPDHGEKGLDGRGSQAAGQEVVSGEAVLYLLHLAHPGGALNVLEKDHFHPLAPLVDRPPLEGPSTSIIAGGQW